MKILILEDEDDKFEKIEASVVAAFSGRALDIERCTHLNAALVSIGSNANDLFIADLMVPQMLGGQEIDATEQLATLLETEAKARLMPWVVITRFDTALIAAKDAFSHHGVTILDYTEDQKWPIFLEAKLENIAGAEQYDFIIFCALEKERSAFKKVPEATLGDQFSANGLNCQKLKISDLNGLCIRTPQMGLVDSAIACARALELFRPKAVAMSGICGGRKGEATIGTLIVPEMCWNYQTGKFKNGSLQFEPNSVPIPATVNTTLAQLLANSDKMVEIRDGFLPDKVFKFSESMQPLVSGSSVLADASAVDDLGLQHRKVAGVDMEMYSIFRAASQFYEERSIFFGAKTVVDMADANKTDKYHEYGSILSARFVSMAMQKIITHK